MTTITVELASQVHVDNGNTMRTIVEVWQVRVNHQMLLRWSRKHVR